MHHRLLNFGNPEKPEAFWEFRESVKGLAESCKKIYLKGIRERETTCSDSLWHVIFYNESPAGIGRSIAGHRLCGNHQDVDKAVTQELKKPDDRLYLIGPRFDELGGSEYYKTIFEVTGANVPVVRFDLERSMINAVIDAIDQGLVHACHDISNGGLAATVAEMALTRPARFGFELDLDKAAEPEPGMRTDKILFSESAGFVIEAKHGSEKSWWRS